MNALVVMLAWISGLFIGLAGGLLGGLYAACKRVRRKNP